ncbi:GNAT family N-acetyltransferase [Flexithrix dorotheae]|uniref:GNAT family N-acetyltransferase n=1 Tax=Flexithrix dorotheae TaxID=70993 RepID=UPI00037848E5|nr:GNAT family N-acetyltransferase [Flexithrix dorotheae]
MEIIKVDLSSLEEVAPLFDSYRVFYRQTTDLAGATQFLKERIENGESVIFLAKSEKGEAIGFIQLYPIFSSVSMAKTWLLNDLFVHPEHRKKSVATKLMDRAKALAKSTNSPWILLETEASNHRAQALYEKIGFKKTTDYFYFLEVK